MPQSFASLHCHIIFSTKGRQPLIAPDFQARLYEYIGGIARNQKCVLIAAGGMPDHIHLLVSMGREIAVAELVRLIKANSSKWIHETISGQEAFAWQNGYAAFAVSFSQIDDVKRYLARQEEHHRKRTFQQEFVDYLNRHGIQYEDRYLWD